VKARRDLRSPEANRPALITRGFSMSRKLPSSWLLSVLLGLAGLVSVQAQEARRIEAQDIPEPLRGWQEWATWDDKHRACPTPYNDARKHLCFWPSQLAVEVTAEGGRFELAVEVFHETWVPLPGSADAWPLEVTANGAAIPAIEHAGKPSVRLPAGKHRIQAVFRWKKIPQTLAIPPEIGVLALTVEGQPVTAPEWSAGGLLWLKPKAAPEQAEKDFVSVRAYSLLADGIPLTLTTQIELTVSGKSREEQLGRIFPEGWKLSELEGGIPVAVNDAGQLRAQVRAGKWTIRASAFRLDPPQEIRFPPEFAPLTKEQLIGFRAKPELRSAEIGGLPAVDVSQTTFPDEWRDLPVFRWETVSGFQLTERMRGMGERKPEGLTIARQLWLDDDGRGFTFQDAINGHSQQIWRLDAAEGLDLGAVSSAGQGQLITRNPQSGAPGVEIRTRRVDLQATGRIPRGAELSASGWRADAEQLNAQIHLPPGWRLVALFGADSVEGDWLTAWTLPRSLSAPAFNPRSFSHVGRLGRPPRVFCFWALVSRVRCAALCLARAARAHRVAAGGARGLDSPTGELVEMGRGGCAHCDPCAVHRSTNSAGDLSPTGAGDPHRIT
jgi:hypothetical protein